MTCGTPTTKRRAAGAPQISHFHRPPGARGPLLGPVRRQHRERSRPPRPRPSHVPPPPCAVRIVAGLGAPDVRNRGSHAAPAGRQDGGDPSNRGRAVTRSQRGMLLPPRHGLLDQTAPAAHPCAQQGVGHVQVEPARNSRPAAPTRDARLGLAAGTEPPPGHARPQPPLPVGSRGRTAPAHTRAGADTTRPVSPAKPIHSKWASIWGSRFGIRHVGAVEQQLVASPRGQPLTATIPSGHRRRCGLQRTHRNSRRTTTTRGFV